MTDEAARNGSIFFYLNGVRFGAEDEEENIRDFFYRVHDGYSDQGQDFPTLFALSGSEFYEVFKVNRGEAEVTDDKIASAAATIDNPGVFDLDYIIRAEYAFDNFFVALIPDGDQEKLIVQYDGSPEFVECVMQRGTFFDAFAVMYHKCKALPSTALV